MSSQLLYAKSWTITSSAELIKNKQKKSVLHFKNPKGESFIYRPLDEPFTLLDQKEFIFEKKSFFLTIWAYGARSVWIRVFHPDKSQINPICTAVSDSYNPQMRVNEQYLEVEEVISELGKKSIVKWKKCISFPGK